MNLTGCFTDFSAPIWTCLQPLLILELPKCNNFGFLFLLPWPCCLNTQFLSHLLTATPFKAEPMQEHLQKQEKRKVKQLRPLFKAISSCMTSMDLPSLERKIAEWKLSSLLSRVS